MTSLPSTGIFTTVTTRNGQAKQAQDDMLEFLREDLGGAPISELTIDANGEITPTSGLHTVDTFSDAASDNLDNILTTNLATGRLLLLRAESPTRTVVVKHLAGGAGQISLSNAVDFSLTEVDQWLLLFRDGADWAEIGRFTGLSAVMTTRGDVIYQGATGPLRLGIGTSGQVLASNGTDPVWQDQSSIALPRGYIDGYITGNGTDNLHDIDIAAGSCRSTDNTVNINTSAALSKQIDVSWAEGGTPATPAGGLFTGTVAADTTYHIFLIRKDADGTIDAGFDTSTTGTNKPVGWTVVRRIASLYTDATSNLVQYFQWGDRFILDKPYEDFEATATTTATLYTLSVPTGFKFIPIGYYAFWSPTHSNLSQFYGIASSPDQTDNVPDSGLWNFAIQGTQTSPARASQSVGGMSILRTNTSAQIRMRSSSTAPTWVGVTQGWEDSRGQNA